MQEGRESYRLYSCRGGSVSVSVCGRCDHGNIFCAGECASVSRRQSRRRAGARYQRTRRGAQRHAARQQRWRERRAKKVTHQGCAPTEPVFTMAVAVDVTVLELTDAPSTPDRPLEAPCKTDYRRARVAGRCDFCRAPLPLFTRLGTRRGWVFS